MHPTTLRRLATAALATTALAAAGAGPASAAAPVTVPEGDSGNAFVNVAIDDLPGSVVIWKTVDGTATAGSDYTPTPFGLLVIPASGTGTVSIPVLGDTLHEGDETFDVNFAKPGVGVIATKTVTIVDDDPAPTVKVSNPVVHENDGTATFDLALSRPSGLPVTADWATADGTATEAGDYQGAAGHLMFAPGETTKSVTVRLTDDSVHEADETFSLRLSGVTGTSGAPTGATATILDDDPAPPSLQQQDQQPAPQRQDNRTAPVAVVGPELRADWPRLAYRGLTRSGWVRLSASCRRGVECGGMITLRSGKRTVGAKAYALEPGQRRVLAVRLSRAARQALARRHRLRVTARTGGGPVLSFTIRR